MNHAEKRLAERYDDVKLSEVKDRISKKKFCIVRGGLPRDRALAWCLIGFENVFFITNHSLDVITAISPDQARKYLERPGRIRD